MSSTDGLIGNGMFNTTKTYKRYNAEHYFNILQNIYKRKESKLLDNGFPKIWTYELLKIHNCIICSSVIIEKSIIDLVGYFVLGTNGEDYEYWLRCLKYTDSVYIEGVHFYYDNNHGDGRNY
jgi:hypothetical protein